MPYSSVKDLPPQIKKLPYKAQVMFMKAFNSAYGSHKDDVFAFKVAWSVVKKRFKKVNGKWVAKGFMPKLYTFDIEMKDPETFITKADDGNYYLEGVLADTLPDSEGKAFTEEALKEFEKQINSGQIIGGITHKEYQELIMKYSHLPTDEFIAKALSERKGILKTIKAIYDKGKLWIKALIDKRYLNHIKKFKKMSIEAFVPKELQQEGKYLGGRVLGFALDNRAINPRAIVAKVE